MSVEIRPCRNCGYVLPDGRHCASAVVGRPGDYEAMCICLGCGKPGSRVRHFASKDDAKAAALTIWNSRRGPLAFVMDTLRVEISDEREGDSEQREDRQ